MKLAISSPQSRMPQLAAEIRIMTPRSMRSTEHRGFALALH
jgi:hypothetical protein